MSLASKATPFVFLVLQGCNASPSLGGSADTPLVTTAAPFSALGCPKATAIDPNQDWLFQNVPWHHSSNCDVPVYKGTGDVAKICVDENNEPDYTSIFVDMTAHPSKNRTGCFQWYMHDCTIPNLRKVKKIEFDIDMQGCEDVWAAPFWMYASPWTWPGQISGEIDLAEMCPMGSVSTNFGSPGQPGEVQKSWAPTSSTLGRPKHFVMKFDTTIPGEGGTLSTTICDLDGVTNCAQGAYYEKFLDTVASTTGNHSYPYTFTADVWNGFGGDGFSACKAKNSPETKCNYAVKNIRVTPSDGKPIFDGKCAKLNAAIAPPAPTPAPAPTPPAPAPAPTPPAPGTCQVGQLVQCHAGSSARCTGDQCCPNPDETVGGTVTCPSSATAKFAGCTHAKTEDCTNGASATLV